MAPPGLVTPSFPAAFAMLVTASSSSSRILLSTLNSAAVRPPSPTSCPKESSRVIARSMQLSTWRALRMCHT
eukprot:1193562-Prorocentrum_minimum.AAC.5